MRGSNELGDRTRHKPKRRVCPFFLAFIILAWQNTNRQQKNGYEENGTMDKSVIIHIRKEEDIVIARKMGRELSQKLNFQTLNQTRVMTAASELARNIYRYARHGQIKFELVEDTQRRAIRITAQDNGPGIDDIKRALMNGYSTSGGLGAGIPGVKKMMDEFAIDSSPETGTTVTAVKWQS